MKGITLKTFLVAAGSLLAAASLTFSSGAGALTGLELKTKLEAQQLALQAKLEAQQLALQAKAEARQLALQAKAEARQLDLYNKAFARYNEAIARCEKLGKAHLPASFQAGLHNNCVAKAGTPPVPPSASAAAPPPPPTVSYAWVTAWGTCSRACGGGTQTLNVSCQDSSHNNATASLCTATKPSAASRPCNAQACATTVDITPPTVPGSLKATATSCSAIEVTWNASTDTGGSGLKGYDVYRDGNLLTQVMAPLSGLSDSALQPATGHSYAVAAFDGQGNRSARSGAQDAPTPACSAGGAPQVLGSLQGFGYPDDLAFDAIGGVVIGVSKAGLAIADLTDPSRPALAARLDLPQLETGVAIQNGLAYVVEQAAATESTLAVVDVSNPRQPIVVARVGLSATSARGIALAGAFAYVGTASGLATVDLTTPRAPRLVGITNTTMPLVGVEVGDGVLLAKTPKGLAIFDIRDARRPAFSWENGSPAGALALVGHLDYEVSSFSLFVWDWSDLKNPRLLGWFNVASGAIAAAGDRVFLSSVGGMSVYDLSDPKVLRLVSEIALPRPVAQLAVQGELVVGVDLWGTLSTTSVPR